MSNAALTISGTCVEEDGAISNVTGAVSEPEAIDGSGDWVCTVSCPGLFPDEIIKGASAAQALHLSRLFLLDALETNNVTIKDTGSSVH